MWLVETGKSKFSDESEMIPAAVMETDISLLFKKYKYHRKAFLSL